ncbi:MFS transporter [Micromonospora sp. NPDC049060]|uniref:MFS transporter n=1 Tax=Micromonospora sp. NPDC049060 TaxID=3154828 RepID=UPI003403BA28
MFNASLLTPLRLPKFRRVWIGQLTNVVGDALYTVAVALFLLPRDDAAQAVGLVLGMTALGGVVSLLIGGALADRHRRSRMIIISDLIRAAAVLGIILVGNDAPLVVLGVLAAVLGIGSGFYRPAYGAILPSLVPEEMLASANGLRSLVNRFGVIVGAALGGAVAAAFSPTWALGIDIVTFLVSIVTLLRLNEPAPSLEGQGSSLAADIKDGFAYVVRLPWMAGVMLQGTLHMAMVAAPVAVMLPILTGPEGWFGYISAAEGGGAFLGAMLASSIRTRSPGWVATFVLLLQLPQTVLLAMDGHPALILVASALTGFGLATFAVLWTTALQRTVPRGRLGRVFSIDQLTVFGLMPVGYLLAGWLLEGLGPATLGWVATVILVVSTLMVLPLPGLRRLGMEEERVPDLAVEGAGR